LNWQLIKRYINLPFNKQL